MRIILDPNNIADYRRFLAIKRLPNYGFRGCIADVPDEYADRIGMEVDAAKFVDYEPPIWMFDYQADVTKLAIRKRKFSCFIECGLGKTAILLEFARHAARSMPYGKKVLIVSPLMVVDQTMQEAERFYPEGYTIAKLRADTLQAWLSDGGDTPAIGIVNYDAIKAELTRGRLGGLILDESSMLKSHYGAWGMKLLEMGRGLEWKLCCTGTPAPNDRIEYGNHAVFMDAFPNVNAETIPPIHVRVHDVPLTEEQSKLTYAQTGRLFADQIGGITSRSVLSQIAKGSHKGKPVSSNKPAFIRDLIAQWPEESTLVWCRFNAEQDLLAKTIPHAVSLTGSTPLEVRSQAVADFKAGRLKVLISKPKILGFGLNLQRATRQVFSACDDSYEDFHQCVKRSNRVGSTRPLNVHIPVTEIERPLMENVLRKAHMVQRDTEEQERIFKDAAIQW